MDPLVLIPVAIVAFALGALCGSGMTAHPTDLKMFELLVQSRLDVRMRERAKEELDKEIGSEVRRRS